MFTGLVETIGTVLEYRENDVRESNGVSITIGECHSILGDVNLGDSISTNGICLTVTEFNEERSQFKVGVSPETLRRTNIGDVVAGFRVNLERAVSSETRMGGHVVQGHIDTVATITRKEADGNAISFTFQLREKEFVKYIVEKGFIAVDGTSLTVTGVNYKTAEFSIMMVSYTQGKVIMPLKSVGDKVNIEVDLTGKLIEKQIEITLTSQLETESSPLATLISSLIEKKISSLRA